MEKYPTNCRNLILEYEAGVLDTLKGEQKDGGFKQVTLPQAHVDLSPVNFVLIVLGDRFQCIPWSKILTFELEFD